MFVKDLSLAETGSIQISLAEKDMPGGLYVIIRTELNNNANAYTVHYKFKATLIE